MALARDALTSGDRIAAETYHQHAEHYFRIVNSTTDPQPNGQGGGQRQDADGQGDNAAGQNRADVRGPDNGQGRGQDRGNQTAQADTRPQPEQNSESTSQPKAQPSEDGADDTPAGD